MKQALGRVLSGVMTAGGWVLFGARTMLDFIGYSTIPEDVAVAKSRLDQAIGLFLSIPWWALLGFALISTVWLMWVSWPRQAPHVPPDADVKSESPKAIQKHELLPAPDVTKFGEKGIYIGRVLVETDKLQDDLVMLFVAVGFNASGYAFKMESVEGCVSFVSKIVEGSSEKIDLPTPRYAAERGPGGKVQNLTEFMYIFEQRVPKALASEIVESATEKHTEFHFDKLTVTVAADSTKLRLPLWQAITIKKPWEQFSTGRIIFAKAESIATSLTGN